ncbi:MAG: beta-propeller domain-containing protein [Phycisphaerae bacterium]
MLNKTWPAAALSAVALLFVAGCPLTTGPGTTSTAKPRLRPFESESEFVNYFKDQATARTRGAIFPAVFELSNVAPTAAAGSADTATSGDTSSGSFSGTNLQEAGVDESDVMKSDGTNLYIAAGGKLRVVRASPREQMSEIGSLSFGDSDNPVYINEMYLYGKNLLILASKFSYYGGPEMLAVWPPYYQSAESLLFNVDVTDPTTPTITQQRSFDGTLSSSRLTNDRLILVISIVPTIPATPLPLPLTPIGVEDFAPKSRINDAAVEMVPWDHWLRPESPDGYYMTAVMTLDAKDVNNNVGSVAVMANAGTIYASTEALYLTDSDYDQNNNYRESVVIHKFKFDSNGAATYTASGTVPGRLLNQFSLGEYQGNLSVATNVAATFTLSGGTVAVSNGGGGVVFAGVDDAASPPATAQSVVAPEPPYNAVYVVGEKDAELQVLGKVEGIAPGEQIFAARFMGKRGFLVTFRRVDPLFSLDLSDPTAPKVVGELKIPGYSDYLHPVGDTHLIGVGRSASTNQFGGTVPDKLQLSLFDLTDPANPKTVQQIEIGGSYSSSDVSYTHKAFTFLADRNLLAIPATLMKRVSSGDPFFPSYDTEFDGALVFRVDPASGFTALGRIANQTPSTYYYYSWRRAAFIGDDAYSITDAGVRAASINDFSATSSVTFAP